MRPEPTWRDKLGAWLGKWCAEFMRSDVVTLEYDAQADVTARIIERMNRDPLPPVKLGHDVLSSATYYCSLCGYEVQFEYVDSARTFAQQRYAVAACKCPTCRLYNVRLKVPVTVLPNCEILEEPVQL
jgi:hypothetical protein